MSLLDLELDEGHDAVLGQRLKLLVRDRERGCVLLELAEREGRLTAVTVLA